MAAARATRLPVGTLILTSVMTEGLLRAPGIYAVEIKLILRVPTCVTPSGREDLLAKVLAEEFLERLSRLN